jgi:hypothetical protein
MFVEKDVVDQQERIVDEVIVIGSGVRDSDVHYIVDMVISVGQERDHQRVLSIRQITHDEVEVRTGEVRGPLDADGNIYLMRREGNDWRVYRIMSWLS